MNRSQKLLDYGQTGSYRKRVFSFLLADYSPPNTVSPATASASSKRLAIFDLRVRQCTQGYSQVFSRRGDNELSVFDPAHAQHLVGEPLYFSAAPFHDDDFQTIVVIQMHMRSGQNALV